MKADSRFARLARTTLLLPLCSLSAFAQNTAEPGSTSTEAAIDEETVILSPFVVSAGNETGYLATETLAGMRLFPTRAALDIAVAAAAVVVVGILLFQPAIVAWGGALIVGLCLARAITLLSVARVRTAGFEMVWRTAGRSLRVTRGHTVELLAEVRNRDTRAVRFAALRVLAAPSLRIEVFPASGEVPAGGRLEVTVKVRPLRVGRHGLFGLGLEMQGGSGLFEVPLTFANPFGIEVLPMWCRARRLVRIVAANSSAAPANAAAQPTSYSTTATFISQSASSFGPHCGRLAVEHLGEPLVEEVALVTKPGLLHHAPGRDVGRQ